MPCRVAVVAYFAAYFAEKSRHCIYCDGIVRAGGWDDEGWNYELGIDEMKQAHQKCHKAACGD